MTIDPRVHPSQHRTRGRGSTAHWIAFSSIALAASTTAETLPVGYAVDDRHGYVVGCAHDPDSTGAAITIAIHPDTATSTPYTFTASLSAPSLNSPPYCAVANGNHGFRFRIPATHRSAGKKLYAFALDAQTSTATALATGTPSSYIEIQPGSESASLNQKPFGWIDEIKNGVITGWVVDPNAQDTGTSTTTYEVFFKPFYAGTPLSEADDSNFDPLGGGSTTVYRAGLATAGYVGNVGFEFAFTATLDIAAPYVFYVRAADAGASPASTEELVSDKGVPARQLYARGDSALGISAQIGGRVETVFDQATDACGTYDFPDLYVRAFRYGSYTYLLRGNAATGTFYGMKGANFSTLDPSCAQAVDMLSVNNDDTKTAYADDEWPSATWVDLGGSGTSDDVVWGVIHNELRIDEDEVGGVGWNCPAYQYGNSCHHVSLTAARIPIATSETFCRWNGTSCTTTPNGDHLIATYPLKPGPPPNQPFGAGYWNPSNVIAKGDGYYYILFGRQTLSAPQQETCIMRTDDLSNPGAWRLYGPKGATTPGFDVVPVDPMSFQTAGTYQAAHDCEPITVLGGMRGSVIYHEGFQRYILVDRADFTSSSGNPNALGVYYSVSEDLIHWGTPHPLLKVKANPPDSRYASDAQVYLYSTLIDHGSTSDNFDRMRDGVDAYLYFVRSGQSGGNLTHARDLIRVPIRFRQRTCGLGYETAPALVLMGVLRRRARLVDACP